MERSEFIRMCAILGIGAPLLSQCTSSPTVVNKLKSGEKIIIIGAGAAGLSAAYLLAKKGIDFKILEAKNTYGGRIESVKNFVDFTIPVGAEWLHTREPVLEEIVADKSIDINIQTTSYDFDNDYGWDAEKGKKVNLKALGFSKNDLRFTNSSWMDFYESFIIPSIEDKIEYNQVVQSIDYSKSQTQIKTQDKTYKADRVFVTVPVTILKSHDIKFSPSLPPEKLKAISNLNLYGGCKCFIAFKEQFYPTCVKIEDAGKGPTRVYFDAAYGKKSKFNVLGLLAVDHYAEPYLSLKEPDRIQFILEELDNIFDGKASQNYIKHVFKNWSDDPYAKGTYYPEFSMKIYSAVSEMSKPVNDKLFFTGDLYTHGNSGWSMVHVAAESSRKAVQALLGDL